MSRWIFGISRQMGKTR